MNPELASSYGLKRVYGIIINGVAETGPADKAGLVPGNVITHVNDTEVENTQHLLNLVSQVLPGNEITIKGIGQRGKFETEAEVIQRPLQQEK
jgi:S1-C subfamily serine protease